MVRGVVGFMIPRLYRLARTLMLAALSVGMVGCAAPRTERIVTVRVVSVRIEDDDWGCIGENHKTLIETEDGWRVEWCGVYGQPGDTFKAAVIRPGWADQGPGQYLVSPIPIQEPTP